MGLSTSKQLILEINEKMIPEGTTLKGDKFTLTITPPINEGYWFFRVRVSDNQAVVGFPKFSTIGIGFAKEEDWNTNLPYQCETKEIYNHISHNKGDNSIPKKQCLEAIRLIQDKAKNLTDCNSTK